MLYYITCLEEPEDGVAIVHDGVARIVRVKHAVVGGRSCNYIESHHKDERI